MSTMPIFIDSSSSGSLSPESIKLLIRIGIGIFITINAIYLPMLAYWVYRRVTWRKNGWFDDIGFGLALCVIFWFGHIIDAMTILIAAAYFIGGLLIK